MEIWPAESIWEQVSPLLPGFTVEVLPEIDSTNTELMRRARAGQTEPTLLVAERQTAGRGRMGRPWQSAVGDSLTFSLGLPLAPKDWSGLSLAVGLSVAESLHAEICLKWPNDLWWQERKLAGILIETAWNTPGATVFTRTPMRANSRAIAWIICWSSSTSAQNSSNSASSSRVGTARMAAGVSRSASGCRRGSAAGRWR